MRRAVRVDHRVLHMNDGDRVVFYPTIEPSGSETRKRVRSGSVRSELRFHHDASG